MWDTVWGCERQALDWPPFLRGLSACQRLETLTLDDRQVGNAALELTALTRLTELKVHGADEAVQAHLVASLGARCTLFPPLSPSLVNTCYRYT